MNAEAHDRAGIKRCDRLSRQAGLKAGRIKFGEAFFSVTLLRVNIASNVRVRHFNIGVISYLNLQLDNFMSLS